MKTWVLEQAVWSEKNLKGKTGAEKRAAVVLLTAWRKFGLWYAGVAVAHLGAYRWYAGEASDFRWF